jgi:hypothetical protein
MQHPRFSEGKAVSYETWHWRIYNVLRRLVGIMACVAGTAFLLTPLFLRIGWMRDDANGPAPFVADFIVGALALSVGVYLSHKPTFRPDLGDVGFWTDSTGGPMRQQPPRGHRSWWTGDSREPRTYHDHAA